MDIIVFKVHDFFHTVEPIEMKLKPYHYYNKMKCGLVFAIYRPTNIIILYFSTFLTDFKKRGGSQFDWNFFFFFFYLCYLIFSPIVNRFWWFFFFFFWIGLSILSDWYQINLVKFWWSDQWQNNRNLQFLWSNNRNYNKKKKKICN